MKTSGAYSCAAFQCMREWGGWGLEGEKDMGKSQANPVYHPSFL